MNAAHYFEMPDNRRIAYRFSPGEGPTIVFLPGYMSDMAGGKANAVFDWAAARGRACLLLDYSGCGQSDGDFADGTLSKWRDEVLALIDSVTGNGPVLLIGSSMGGWLMLMIALALDEEQRTGLLGIAAAPDFTDWGKTAEEKAVLASGQPVFEDNPYGPEPTPTYPDFWADGESNKLLGGPLAIDCPVRLLHGQQDTDVPWDISVRLMNALQSHDVRISLIKDGDHRLSRDQDIALLLQTLEEMEDLS